jgi:hypothetical protein
LEQYSGAKFVRLPYFEFTQKSGEVDEEKIGRVMREESGRATGETKDPSEIYFKILE